MRRQDHKLPLFIGQPEFSSGVRSPHDQSQIPVFITIYSRRARILTLSEEIRTTEFIRTCVSYIDADEIKPLDAVPKATLDIST